MRIVRAQFHILLIRTIGLVLLLLTISCSDDRYLLDRELPKYPCKVQGACDATIMKYIAKLNKKNVRVITIGQDYLVSIPADMVFENQSPLIKWKSYALLNEVVIFLKQFYKITIYVNSYSSNYGTIHREKALTLARARVISDYIWSQGVDSRFIFTQGVGSDKPIITLVPGNDHSPNARIEITFRNAVA